MYVTATILPLIVKYEVEGPRVYRRTTNQGKTDINNHPLHLEALTTKPE